MIDQKRTVLLTLSKFALFILTLALYFINAGLPKPKENYFSEPMFLSTAGSGAGVVLGSLSGIVLTRGNRSKRGFSKNFKIIP